MLTNEQQIYFDNIVNNIKQKLNIDIPIIAYDHNLFKKKDQIESIGLAWKNQNNEVFQITINTSIIIEYCKEVEYIKEKRQNENIFIPIIENKLLKESICHEIAHIIFWQHGKKHNELTKQLLKQIQGGL